MRRHWTIAFIALASVAAVGTASAAETGNCAQYIDSMPQDPYDPPGGNGENDDHTYAWYEPSNDNVVIILDGRRFRNPQELVDRLHESDSALHVIARADFTGWDFRELEAPLTGLCFYRSKLAGTRWDGRDLSRGAFVESDLSSARFSGAILENVLIRDSRLVQTDMRSAKLAAGKLDGSWFADLTDVVDGGDEKISALNGWNLSDANLAGFTFDCGIEVHNGCPVDRQIDFSRANLTQVDMARFPGWGAFNLSGARIDQTRLHPRQLPFYSSAEFAGTTIVQGFRLETRLNAEEVRSVIATYDLSDKWRQGPSFDCSRAGTPVEQMICSEEGGQSGLWVLDRELSTAYAEARKRDARVADVQKAWFRLRAQCKGYDCLVSVYQKRLSSLLGVADMPGWLAKGTSALFVEGELAPDRRLQDDPAMRKLWPIIADAASQLIVVTHEADGTLSIRGRAIGANAHTCSIDARGLRMDPKSGWFSLWSDRDHPQPAIRIIGEELFVIGDGKPDPEVFPEIDFVSCGARASFVASGHIPASPATLDKFLQDDAF